MDVVILFIRLALAVVFAAAAVAKLLDLPTSRQTMRDFGVPEPLAQPAGIALPLVELAIALLLLPVATATGGAILALLLLLAFIGAVGANLARDNRPDCNCFGQLHSEPIGWPTLARNSVLAALALVAAVSGLAGAPGPSLLGWTSALGGFGWLTLIGAVALTLATAGALWLLLHLLGQNGRLLARIDRIETALADADIEIADDADDDDEDGDDAEAEGAAGVGIGSAAPDFDLLGIYGERMTLDALRAGSKPVLLIFSSPSCAACNVLLPDIGAWQRERSDHFTTAIISRGGDAGKAAEHGLINYLTQQANEVADDYQVTATPTGIVVRADGTIGSPPALGADAIRTLAASLVRHPNPALAPAGPAPRPEPAVPPPASDPSRPQPNPLPIGAPAPAIELLALRGGKANLNQLGKQPTAVVLFDPVSPLCQDMVLDLKTREANPPAGAPKMVIISGGDLKAVRALGLRSRILLDPTFQAVGAFGTAVVPAAVLIDAEGRVASTVAYGARAILALTNGQDPSNAPADGSNRIGWPAPTFDLPTLDGERVRLADRKGQRTLLLFWDPTCGYCQRMLADLKQWRANPPDGAPTMLIVSRGDPEAIRAQELPAPVLLDADADALRKFRCYGTPTGVLIDADGRIASPIAMGAQEFFTLANGGDIATLGAPTAPAATAKKIGAPAPDIALPDLDGRTVRLRDFRGRPTAVLFWRPGCGFCQRMLDDLKAWEANPPADAPQLLIVSSEDVASNRAQGLRSPLVLDQDFSVGRAFGSTGTPSAVLVDAAGSIASSVAGGATQVFGLLRTQMAPTSGAAVMDAASEMDDDEDEDDEELPVPPMGSPAPIVRLPDLNGTIVEVAGQPDAPTLLLFWDPECGFCQQMLPALQRWEADPPPGAPKVVFVSSGSVEANKAQGLRSLLVLDDDSAVSESFGADGTPMAIVIDGDGRIASELAEGEDEVLALLGAREPTTG